MKNIHIGQVIQQIVILKQVTEEKMSDFFSDLTENDILQMFKSQSLDSDMLLQWCKLCDYNFFMIYNSHLQLYAPNAATAKLSVQKQNNADAKSLHFNKGIYSNEVKAYILELLEKNQLTILEVISTYNIPKTTLYKWLKKKITLQNQF